MRHGYTVPWLFLCRGEAGLVTQSLPCGGVPAEPKRGRQRGVVAIDSRFLCSLYTPRCPNYTPSARIHELAALEGLNGKGKKLAVGIIQEHPKSIELGILGA